MTETEQAPPDVGVFPQPSAPVAFIGDGSTEELAQPLLQLSADEVRAFIDLTEYEPPYSVNISLAVTKAYSFEVVSSGFVLQAPPGAIPGPSLFVNVTVAQGGPLSADFIHSI